VISSLLHGVQTGFGVHPVSYPMGTGHSFPCDKADHSPSSTAEVRNAWGMEVYPQYVWLHYVVLKVYVFIAWYLVTHRDNFTFKI
jgi:hypothetical protein